MNRSVTIEILGLISNWYMYIKSNLHFGGSGNSLLGNFDISNPLLGNRLVLRKS